MRRTSPTRRAAAYPAGPRAIRARVIGSFGLKSETNIRKAARTGFTRPVDIPDAFIEHVLGMTHRAFVGAMRAPLVYLGQRSLPDRLTALGLAGEGYRSCRRND